MCLEELPTAFILQEVTLGWFWQGHYKLTAFIESVKLSVIYSLSWVKETYGSWILKSVASSLKWWREFESKANKQDQFQLILRISYS